MRKATVFGLTMVLAAAFALPAYAEEAAAPEAAEANEDGKIGTFQLAPKLGGVFMMEHGGGDFKIPARNGFKLDLELAFGGVGSNFVLTPFFEYQVPDVGNDFMEPGLFIGGVYRMHFGDWYPHFGGGLRLGYLMADGVDWGLEIGARIPVGVTYYLLEDLGLVAELGIGYSSELIKYPGLSFDYGHGLAFDFTVGIRWP